MSSKGFCRGLMLMLASTVIGAPAYAGTITIGWDRNTESNIAGYRLAYGTQSGVYSSTIDVGNNTSYQVHSMSDATVYYFVVLAYDTAGHVSAPSQELRATIFGISALVPSGTSPSPTGQPLSWTAVASSGVALEYQFARYSQATSAWTTVQPYSTSNTLTWTPGSTEEGTYAIMVWVRPVGSTLTYQSYRSTGMFSVSNTIKVGLLEPDVALPSSTGRTITWTAKAIGGPAPLQYQFWRFQESTGTWTIVQPFGAATTYSWTPAAGQQGRYAVQVWVRRAGSTAAYDDYKSTGVFDIKDGPVIVASLTPSTGLPAGTGGAITWKAIAAGGPGPLEYQFYRFSQSAGTWTIVQPYGSSDSFTWTPTTADTYAIQVWVRRRGMTPAAGYEAYKSSGYFQIANSAVTITSMWADRSAPVGTNGPITWTVTATGGPGPLQYQYYMYDTTRETWVVLKPWSGATSVTWTPNTDDIGTYAAQVWVRKQGTTSGYDAYASTGFFTVANTMPAAGIVTVDTGTNARAGAPITLSVQASGGPGLLEYKFVRYAYATGAWTVVQDYSWDPTFAWTPLPGDEGSYGFQVMIRRPGSTAPYDGWAPSDTIVVN